MIKDVVLEIFGSAWPMIVIFTIILASIRIAYLVLNKKDFILYKELTSLFFLIYVLSLFYIVTFQDETYSTLNLIPFKEILRYDILSKSFIKNVIGNILLYMPFGLFVTAYLNNKKILPTILLTAITSVSIEVVQLLIGRVFDVDDILLNIIGGTLGAILFLFLDRIKNKLPSVLKKEWFMNLVAILLLLVAIIYFTNLYDYIKGVIA